MSSANTAISSGVNTIDKTISALTGKMKSAATNAFNAFKGAFTGNGRLYSDLTEPYEQAYRGIWDIDWDRLGKRIYSETTAYTSWISDAYRNAFDFSGMYIKTPHFYVSSWTEVSGTYYPNFGVSWYRKAYDDPIMFTRPTVLGTAGGLKGFGDGPGGEIVLSEDKLRELVGEGGVTNNNTINIYQRDGENLEELARRIEDIFTRQQNQRKAAFA